MTRPLFSAMNRAMYFSIPEQKLIYNAVKMYLEKYPDAKNTEYILSDFHREPLEKNQNERPEQH